MTNLNHNIALLVDGPNMYETECTDIVKVVANYGTVQIQEMFFDGNVPVPLVHKVMFVGFKPINTGSKKDIDTYLTARATEIICSPRYEQIDLIALGTGDVDQIPTVHMAREYAKKILIIAQEKSESEKNGSLSVMLRSAVDYVEEISKRNNHF